MEPVDETIEGVHTPLIATEEPEREATVFEVITRAGPDPGDADGSVCAASQSYRGRLTRKSTLLFAQDVEQDLARTESGVSFLAFLQSGVGMAGQVALLLLVLSIYTFTPEAIAWSKMTSTGLSARYAFSHHPDMVRVEPNGLSGSKLALGVDADAVGSAKFSGFLRVPTPGHYALGLLVDGQRDAPGRVLRIGKEEVTDSSRHALEAGKDYALHLEVPAVKTDSTLDLYYQVGDGITAKTVPRDWLAIDDKVTDPYKGKPYLDASPMVFNEVLLVATASLASLAYGGLAMLKEGFKPANVLIYAPVGFMFVLGDVCEILANGMLDSTTFIVLSQTRLLATALLMRLWLGTQLNSLQWVDLLVLQILVFVFVGIPADFEQFEPPGKGSDQRWGLIFTSVKVTCSVVATVYMQRTMQSPEQAKTPFCVQLTAVRVSGIASAAALLPLTCWYVETPLSKYGLFGGPDGGWDRRTVCIVLIYTAREWAMNLCVKRFDALVKNLCNAVATLCSYLFAIFVVHRTAGLYVCDAALPLSPAGMVRTESLGTHSCHLNMACGTKLAVILGVILLVYNYASGKRYVSVSAGELKPPKSEVQTLRSSVGRQVQFDRSNSRSSTLGSSGGQTPSAAGRAPTEDDKRGAS